MGEFGPGLEHERVVHPVRLDVGLKALELRIAPDDRIGHKQNKVVDHR